MGYQYFILIIGESVKLTCFHSDTVCVESEANEFTKC